MTSPPVGRGVPTGGLWNEGSERGRGVADLEHGAKALLARRGSFLEAVLFGVLKRGLVLNPLR